MDQEKMKLDLENLSLEESPSSFLDTVASFIGDKVPTDDILEGIATQIGLSQKSDKLQTAAFMLSKFAMLELAENVFSVGRGFVSADLTAFTLAQVKSIVQNIEKKVDIVLNTPLQLAFQHFQSAMNMVTTENYKLAYDSFDKLLDKAMEAFEYSRQQGNDIEQLKKTIVSLKMMIFAMIAKYSYNEDNSKFLSFYLLEKRKKDLITLELQAYTRKVLQIQKETKTTKIWPSDRKKEKLEICDLVDSILQITYPYVSEGKGWTTRWSKVDATPVSLTFLPAGIPEGEPDKTMVCIGRSAPADRAVDTKSQGDKNSFFNVYVWKDSKSVYVSRENNTQYVPSEYKTQKFDYPAPEDNLLEVTYLPPLPILVSTTGKSADYVGGLHGLYHLYGQHQGYPVYRQAGGERYLYSTGDMWWVSSKIGKKTGKMKNKSASSKVPVDTMWQYHAGGGGWQDDPYLTMTPSPLPQCEKITITAIGPAAASQAPCLGIFYPTGALASGRQEFRQAGEGKYLLVRPGKYTWGVRDTPDSGMLDIRSASSSVCPGHKIACTNTRRNRKSWQYWDSGKWVEGAIIVTCSIHSE